MIEQKPHYKHDCPKCRFLGRGPAPILGTEGQIYDFWICEATTDRTFIARFGEKPERYQSRGLFQGSILSSLDQIALHNGLDLTPEEDARLLRILAVMWRETLSLKDLVSFSTGAVCRFGGSNAVCRR